jgi:hypothetical protein
LILIRYESRLEMELTCLPDNQHFSPDSYNFPVWKSGIFLENPVGFYPVIPLSGPTIRPAICFVTVSRDEWSFSVVAQVTGPTQDFQPHAVLYG